MSQRNEIGELARAVMELITTGHRQISRRLDLNRLQVLGVIIADGPVRPARIAAQLNMTASAVSRHLTALQDSGQVVILDDPADARTFMVQANEASRGELDAAVEAGTAVFAEVIADWSEEDVHTARVLIERLNAAWAKRHAAARTPAKAPTSRRRGRARHHAGGRPEKSEKKEEPNLHPRDR